MYSEQEVKMSPGPNGEKRPDSVMGRALEVLEIATGEAIEKPSNRKIIEVVERPAPK